MEMVRWPRVVAGAVGLAWYLLIGGASTINPLNSKWLAGDWLQHWTGFLFFKQEPWAFPLGTLASIPYPYGTSIGFTDSNPLVAFALKPFASWLPAEFQFIGLWLLLCFGLQGYFGALLCSVVTRNPLQQALGGSLFALSPVLANRVGHDTLCAQWLVLALLYLGLRPYEDGRQAGRGAIWAVATVALAAFIHPYLTVMCFVLAVACLFRLFREGLLPIARAGVMVATAGGAVAAIFWMIGYLGAPGSATGGFGIYSANLNALFDSQGTSRLVPFLPNRAGQWEGFAFPGLGGWLLIVAASAWIATRPAIDWRHRRTIVWTAVILAIYSLSSHITLGEEIVAHVRKLYRVFEPVPSLFRASGRFIWPLHYLALLFGVWGVSRLSPRLVRQNAATAILAIAVIVQAADFRMPAHWFAERNPRQAPLEEFQPARGHYSHLVLYPPQMAYRCDNGPVDEERVFRYALLAYRLGLTYNSGTFARASWENVQSQCKKLDQDVEAGQFDSRTIFVVESKSAEDVQAAGAICNRFDGDWVCVSPRNTDPFRVYVETGRTPVPK